MTTTESALTPDVRNGIDFKVADLSLADFGRKEIRLAEHEMPGLMSLRREYAEVQPLKGARVSGSLHMTVQRTRNTGPLEGLHLGVLAAQRHQTGHLVLGQPNLLAAEVR